MEKKEKEFLERLQAAFKIEANERLQAISSGMLELENSETHEGQASIIETIFRETHSLKGAARAVSMTDIEAICHAMEGVFAALKRNELKLSIALFDAFSGAVNILKELISPSKTEKTAVNKDHISGLVQQINLLAAGELKIEGRRQLAVGSWQLAEDGSAGTSQCRDSDLGVKHTRAIDGPITNDNQTSSPHTARLADSQASLSEAVKVAVSKLDAIMLQAEEMIPLKTKSHQFVMDIKDVLSMFDIWKKEWARFYPELKQTLISWQLVVGGRQQKPVGSWQLANPDPQILNPKSQIPNPKSARLLEFLDWNYVHTKSVETKLETLSRLAKQDHDSIDLMADNLIDDIKKVLMLPCSWLLKIFPKLVRDLSKDQGKEAKLVIQGSEVEIDRRILEEMKDPLIHMLRNSIDHGIETPENRIRHNKPRKGTIAISVSHLENGKVEICVSDDGAGIDAENVKKAAVKQGVISQEQAETISRQETLSLIFQSGISTNPIITDISGRGIGLAILQENVKRLGGSISVETEINKETIFRMIFPLTIATFRGIFVEAGDQIFVVPSANVERVVRIDKNKIKTVENMEFVILNDCAVPFVRLSEVLKLSNNGRSSQDSDRIKSKANNLIHLLLINVSDKTIAFCVDSVRYEQEVLVKNLGRHLLRVRNIMGAAILRTGKAVAILNVYDLIKSASKTVGMPLEAREDVEKPELKKTVMVVEDSITSRMLLKNILEAAGYIVVTAVDGADAFAALREKEFDLVVSDVEMPRMNGFDLTSNIRNNKRLAEMPVILVTALESREDRERGIDVGANAYIVKSNFDQSNLINAVERLI